MYHFRKLNFAFVLLLVSPIPLRAADPDDIVVESLLRLPHGKALVAGNPNVKQSVERYLLQHEGTREALRAIDHLDLSDQASSLESFLSGNTDSSLQLKALRLLLRFGEKDRIASALARNDSVAAQIAGGLGLIGTTASETMLKSLLAKDSTPAIRIAATAGLGRTRNGQKYLVSLHREGKLPTDCRYAAYDALSSSDDPEVSEIAKALKPAATKSGESLPPVSKLIRMRGDGKAGKLIFHGKGTCAKCHKVHGEGKEVGPDLSEIGSKLSREALYTAILNPSAGISHNYEGFTVLTDEGQVFTGLKISETTQEIVIRTA
ncbi:MAG: c-type cytochrome, partial [Planctomycetota bacterium]